MRRRKKLKDYIPLAAVSYLMVLYMAVKVAPYSYGAAFYNIINHSNEIFAEPLKFRFCDNTLKVILICTFIWLIVFLVFVSDRKYKRPGEEHGSAGWADIGYIKKKYGGNLLEDRIFTRNISISHDSHIHQTNLLSVIIGGSGAGKTRRYVYPNILQANTSFIVTDPKGEIVRATGRFLEQQGYEVKVLDLIKMSKSHSYNPFKYAKTEEDIEKLTNVIMTSTKDPNAKTDDQFWEDTARMELYAYISYLKAMAPEEEQNFATLLELFKNDNVDEENDKYVSPTNMLFNRLKLIDPEHVAVSKYEFYRSGAGKTVKSTQAVMISRLHAFSLKEVQQLTMNDELDLPSLGNKKTALFVVIPDTDKSFNFIVSILYMQLFQQLFYQADQVHDGRLPVPVHIIMDEFANIALPPDFVTMVSTMRSRMVMVSIILQSMSQLKMLFEKQWETIIGNCDELLYLGGNEESTHKSISERLGKETIDSNTYSRTHGVRGSFSTNDQTMARDLMSQNEVAKLKKNDCILFINGEDPVYDRKYEIMDHPNIKYTPLAGKKYKDLEYHYGEAKHSIGGMQTDYDADDKKAKEYSVSDRFLKEYAIYSAEELEKIYKI